MSDTPGAGNPALGSEFAGHRLETVLGQGGMGIVYRARNLALDQDRALKVLAPALSGDQRFRERFRRESRLAASIDHPNVIPVHQAGEEAGHLFLAMRLVEGVDLRHLVVRDGALDPAIAAATVGAAAAGLDAAHAAGLIHRDVKPANILVGEGRDAGRIYITDFGISRSITGGETMTTTGELIGTADFMAPEQIAGDPVDHRADVYALGACLYFALTGEAPFPRDNEIATLFAHANAPRPRPSAVVPSVPPALDAVVERAMAVAPEDRFQSAGELGSAIEAALGGTPPPPPASSTAVTKPLRPPRRGIPAMAVGGVLAVLAVLALVVLFGDAGDGDEAPAPDRPAATVAGATALETPANAIAVGDERVWIAEHDANRVVAINRVSNAVELNIEVPSPKSVAVGFGSVWVVSGSEDAIYRLDPAEDSQRAIPVGEGAKPADVAVDDQWVWVANAGRNEVVRIDPDTDAVDADVPLGTEPRAIATGDGSVWVSLIDRAAINRIDPDEPGRIGGEITVGELPVDIAVGEGGVWVASGQLGSIQEVAPATGDLAGEPIDVGAQPRGIAAGLGFVWVALGGEAAVAQVDPGSRALVGAPIEVGEEPADLALAADAVWVATEGAGSAVRLSPR